MNRFEFHDKIQDLKRKRKELVSFLDEKKVYEAIVNTDKEIMRLSDAYREQIKTDEPEIIHDV
jgi:hypothetical protein